MHQRGLDVWPCPATFSHVLRVGYSGKPCLRFRVLLRVSLSRTQPDQMRTWRPVVANEAPPNARSPLTARAAAPIEDNRRRAVRSFTTSIVGKLLTKGRSSLVEARAHLCYRQSTWASVHVRWWLVGRRTLKRVAER